MKSFLTLAEQKMLSLETSRLYNIAGCATGNPFVVNAMEKGDDRATSSF